MSNQAQKNKYLGKKRPGAQNLPLNKAAQMI